MVVFLVKLNLAEPANPKMASWSEQLLLKEIEMDKLKIMLLGPSETSPTTLRFHNLLPTMCIYPIKE